MDTAMTFVQVQVSDEIAFEMSKTLKAFGLYAEAACIECLIRDRQADAERVEGILRLHDLDECRRRVLAHGFGSYVSQIEPGQRAEDLAMIERLANALEEIASEEYYGEATKLREIARAALGDRQS